jgi:hypothetical protein
MREARDLPVTSAASHRDGWKYYSTSDTPQCHGVAADTCAQSDFISGAKAWLNC